MKVPVLVYHSMRIHGREYQDNDLCALATDLELIQSEGMTVIPLHRLVGALRGGGNSPAEKRYVALTCDDGGDFDFHDLPHPIAGGQRSVLNILRDFKDSHAAASAHITSFVIVSPEARVELDKTCMIGRGWWNDDWWQPAISTGLMDIGNHSWDHNHDALPAAFHVNGVQRGTFSTICTRQLADSQIRVAADYLKDRAPNPGDRLFAYPYGEANRYLVDEYFPAYASEIGIDAAFGDTPDYVCEESQIWDLPRFICARDWKSPAQLLAILREAG